MDSSLSHGGGGGGGWGGGGGGGGLKWILLAPNLRPRFCCCWSTKNVQLACLHHENEIYKYEFQAVLHDPWVCTLITMWVCLSLHPTNIISVLACVTAIFDWRGLLNIISAGCGQLVKMVIIPELHGIHFLLKLAGKMTKKRKYMKKIYWSCHNLNHCAPGCWITRKPPRPPHMKYTLEQFTYITFTCSPQIKIARPLICS